MPANPAERSLVVERTDITTDVARALILALNAELSAMYPEPGATHFRLDPSETAPGAGAFLVATLDGTPVGCGAVRTLADHVASLDNPGRVGEVKRMYVERSVRGSGVGRAIVARIEQEARALGMSHIVLETGVRQVEAIALYRRTGFTEIPAYGEYVTSPVSICFAKPL